MPSLSWAAWLWLAAPWYVDGDAGACPGEGSDAAPYCTIQDAFDNPALAGGDEVLVREAAAAYAGAEVNDVDGSPAAPIVLRPDDRHAPILAGTILIGSSSYWTVRGLTFDGQGNAGASNAIRFETSGQVVEGAVIEGNAILGWGNDLVTVPEDGISSGIIHVASYPPSGGPTMIDPIVRGNRILDGRGKGISISTVSGATIEGNDIGDLSCQMGTNGPGMSGIFVFETGGAEITRNRIRDLDATDCPLVGDLRVVGIWLQGSASAEVHHNLIERMGGQDDTGMGIDVMNSSNDASVHHNIVALADQCGLCNGSMASSGGARARFVNNTVVGGRGSGLELIDGEDSEFLNNVVVGAGRSQARILTTGVATWTFENNVYLPARGRDNIGRFDYAAAVDFAAWQEGCDCDLASVVENPQLPPLGTEDFTPAGTSPVVDRGLPEPEAVAWNGRAPDVGAVEPPIVLQAAISAAEPDRIRLDVQSETSAFRHDEGCAGFSIAIDARAVAATGCELDGGNRLLVGLAEPAYAGAAVVLSYDGWSLSNSDAIGGVVDGLMASFQVDVDNGSDQVPPAGEDGSTTGADAGDASSDDNGATSTSGPDPDGSTAADSSAGAGDYPGLDGCGCNQRPSKAPAFGVWLAFALLLRRRTIA